MEMELMEGVGATAGVGADVGAEMGLGVGAGSAASVGLGVVAWDYPGVWVVLAPLLGSWGGNAAIFCLIMWHLYRYARPPGAEPSCPAPRAPHLRAPSAAL